jgi:hypothetical protein
MRGSLADAVTQSTAEVEYQGQARRTNGAFLTRENFPVINYIICLAYITITLWYFPWLASDWVTGAHPQAAQDGKLSLKGKGAAI